VCVGFERGEAPREAQRSGLSLRFCENGGEQRVLGEIALEWLRTLESGESEFLLFRATGSVNRCLPWWRLWANSKWKARAARQKAPMVAVTELESQAMAVMFTCPRPVSLISVADEDGGNIYPLNVMGDLGEGWFGLCLKHGYLPEKFVERTRRIVLSSVPMVDGPIAYRLGPNHNRPSIDWEQLPFATRPSKTFGIRVPEFACRVREMEVEQVHRLGFHTFFLARVLSDEWRAHVPELCVAHGYYEDWRERRRGVDKRVADAEDAYVRGELSPEQAGAVSARFIG
jgi:hypothetical protein